MQSIIDELTEMGYKVIIMPRVYGSDYYVAIEHETKNGCGCKSRLLIDAMKDCLAIAKQEKQ